MLEPALHRATVFQWGGHWSGQEARVLPDRERVSECSSSLCLCQSGGVSKPTLYRIAEQGHFVRLDQTALEPRKRCDREDGPISTAGKSSAPTLRRCRARYTRRSVRRFSPHLGLHAARQGARQFASLVQAARAVISRRQQRRCPEPVGGSTEHPFRSERDGKQPLFGMGGCGQLEPDWHPGAVASDRHRNRAEPEIIDRDRVSDNATIDPEVAVGIRDIRHPAGSGTASGRRSRRRRRDAARRSAPTRAAAQYARGNLSHSSSRHRARPAR